MAITTHISPRYAGQTLLVGLICLVFGVWGVYDLKWTIPHRRQAFEHYQLLKAEKKKLDDEKAAQPSGMSLSQDKQAAYAQIDAAMKTMSPDGAELTAPGTFDWVVQWIYASGLPCAPYIFWSLWRQWRRRYSLDDDESLHFEGDPQLKSGVWTKEQIADIDMSTWMMKSIAHAAHVDGARLKLDAHLHKNLDLIIGAIAHRLHPDEWTIDAKPVGDDESGESGNESPDSTPNGEAAAAAE